MIGIVYKITNLVNGKCYVGQTIQKVENRWNQHKSSNKNSLIYKAFLEFGVDNFKFEVLVKVDSQSKEQVSELLLMYEDGYISQFNSIENGYNKEKAKKSIRFEERQTNKQIYQKNKIRIKERTKEYYNNNKKKVKEYMKSYRELKKQELIEQKAKYREKNRDELNRKQRKKRALDKLKKQQLTQ